jgi:hypothetical protein
MGDQIKVNDRVRVLRDGAGAADVKAGDLGTVVVAEGPRWPNVEPFLGVRMDEYRGPGSQQGTVFDWAFNTDHVELYQEALA